MNNSTEIDGALNDEDVRDERPANAPVKKQRRSLLRYLRSIVAELRKVVWPTRKEVIKYSIVVLFTLVLMLIIILVLDYAFGEGAIFLFK